MAEPFQFELVSPERLLVSEKVEWVVIPGVEGEMTVLANHAPVMTSVKPGVVTVKPAGDAEERYVVFGGFADILPSGCTLLAESATAVKDIDRDDLARRIQDAKEDVADATDDLTRTAAGLSKTNWSGHSPCSSFFLSHDPSENFGTMLDCLVTWILSKKSATSLGRAVAVRQHVTTRRAASVRGGETRASPWDRWNSPLSAGRCAATAPR
jgi:F-type H+-transporting ATPase subunit epsilon